MAIEIVDLPSYILVIFHSYVIVYQRVACLVISYIAIENGDKNSGYHGDLVGGDWNMNGLWRLPE